jgi:hypothetical protein
VPREQGVLLEQGVLQEQGVPLEQGVLQGVPGWLHR